MRSPTRPPTPSAPGRQTRRQRHGSRARHHQTSLLQESSRRAAARVVRQLAERDHSMSRGRDRRLDAAQLGRNIVMRCRGSLRRRRARGRRHDQPGQHCYDRSQPHPRPKPPSHLRPFVSAPLPSAHTHRGLWGSFQPLSTTESGHRQRGLRSAAECAKDLIPDRHPCTAVVPPAAWDRCARVALCRRSRSPS